MRQSKSAPPVFALLMLGTTILCLCPRPATAQVPVTPAPTLPKDADMETVKTRLFDALLVPAPQARKALSQDAARFRDTLGADGSWPDVNYADQTPGPWKTSRHLDRLLVMAKAYRTPDQPLRGQPGLRAKTLLALDFWLAHDFRNPNWWHNEIGVPKLIGSIMVLMEGETTPAQQQKAAAILLHSTQRTPLKKFTGANLAWIAHVQIIRGWLQHSPPVMAEAFQALWDEVKIVNLSQDGIQADGSFHQHGPTLYNGGYGISFLDDTVSFTTYAGGTRFAIPPDRLRILEDWVIDGDDWMTYTGGTSSGWDPGTLGREITRVGAGESSDNLRLLAGTLAAEPGPRRQELLTVSQRAEPAPRGRPLIGNHHFWDSDFMTHHRAGYYTSARMFSTRTFNTDGFINGEGRLSNHLADGATYLFRRGDEYRQIFPVWDWHRIPGTTAEQAPAPLDPAHVHVKGKTSFVGGVSDGMYGAAAMDLVRDTLSARKAWFYFDDEWVCLGSGITCATDNAVLTSVNQCLLNGAVRVSNQLAPLAAGEHALTGARWVMHDGIGYVFPAQTLLHAANRTQSGKWSDSGMGSSDLLSKDVFSVWIDHGARPDDAAYEYMVIPNTDARALAARVAGEAHPAVETLSNTPSLQAVRHNGSQVLEAVFRQPGRLDAGKGWVLKVDQPCLVLEREMPGGVEIAVSNPENLPLAVTVESDRLLEGEGCTPSSAGTAVRFDLPGGRDAGRSLVRILNRKKAR